MAYPWTDQDLDGPLDVFPLQLTDPTGKRPEDGFDRAPNAGPNSASLSSAWRFFFVPGLNFTTDEGFGAGLTFALFRREQSGLQIDEELRLRLFVTSKFSHRHEISWWIRNVGGLPLRMRTRVGFFSTRSAHFCGLGPHVGCGQDDALAAYRNLLASGPVANSAVPATQDEFLREYYLRRYFLPYFRFLVLWKLFAQWPIELLLGWNLGFEQPGTPNAQFQLPQNKYSELFPNGEAGRHSTMRIGFFSEAIDLEAWPTRGHRALVLVRAADAWSGSSWSFWGIHADFIGYFRFPHKSGNVVATRLLYDEIRGRVPSLELSQVTGLQDVSAFGGPWLGRGIRERRFSGHQKLIYQGEYRVPLAALRVFQHRLGLAVASFLDLAWIRFSPDVPNEFAPYETSDRGLFGLGMGLQLLLDQLFLFRVDVATSPQETQGPYVYAVMGAAF